MCAQGTVEAEQAEIEALTAGDESTFGVNMRNIAFGQVAAVVHAEALVAEHWASLLHRRDLRA